MTLLERLRSATPADLDRDAADVLGLRDGGDFRLTKDGLTVAGETVPLADVRAEMLRVLGLEDKPDGQLPDPPARISITDLEPARGP